MSDVVDVKTAHATYRGLREAGVLRFYGVRYAEPPLGPLRFLPPVPLAERGTVDATRPGLSPAQVRRMPPAWAARQSQFETGEDCLNLNLFTPGADDKSRPVIVHVFGGGFQTGSATGTYHDEAAFVAKGDVVLVRPNFRVGALGFLHLGPVMGEAHAAANRGMLDLVAALKWIKANIAAFGGDPDNITLVGMSSGAFTIAALFGTDGNEDLFRRAWLMSGSASRIVDPDTAAAMGQEFIERAGIAPGDVAALQKLPVETVLAIQEQIIATDLGIRNSPGGHTLGIVADGLSLLRHPLDGLESGRWRNHDVLASWTRDEARMWYAFGTMPAPANRERVLETVARFHGTDAEAVLSKLERDNPDWGLADLEENFLSRTIYRDTALRTARTHAEAGGRAYAYEFRWVPPFEGGRLGAAHASDESFVFGVTDPARVRLLEGSDTAAPLAASMSQALYDFARNGDPGWPQFQPGEYRQVFG